MHHRRSIRLKHFDYSRSGIYFITLCTYRRQEFFGSISNGQMCLSEAGKVAESCWLEIPQHFPDILLDEWVIMPDHIHGLLWIRPEGMEGSPEGMDGGPWIRTEEEDRGLWIRTEEEVGDLWIRTEEEVGVQNFEPQPLPPKHEPYPLPPKHEPYPLPPKHEPYPLPPKHEPHPLPPKHEPYPLPPKHEPYPLPPKHEPHPLPPKHEPHPPFQWGDSSISIIHSGDIDPPFIPYHELHRHYNKVNRYQHIIPRSIGSVIRGFKIGVTKWFRKEVPGMRVWQRNYYESIIRDEHHLRQVQRYIRMNPEKWMG